MRLLLLLIGGLYLSSATAQDAERVIQTFKDDKIVNTHSIETLPARKLDVRIGHRFGDLLGDNGGWPTLYGLENATDVMIGAAYGVTNELSVGFHRTKGSGTLTALLNGTVKYRLLYQKTDNSSPVSLTFVGISTVSTTSRSPSEEAITSFPKTSHRFVHAAQLLVARKFGDRCSFQLIPSYVHRNLVTNEDENGIFSLGAAFRFQINKVLGVIGDLTYPFSSLRMPEGSGFYPPIGIGLEIDTGGHVFQVNFTNATGIIETDYIPYTRSNWTDLEFRLGFAISRKFTL